MNHHERYMAEAMALALKGRGTTSPNPMVGAVLVKNSRIVGRGWHKRCGGPHAEIEALKDAGGKARGAVLYVTLEPCYHQGRTPPCVDAVIAAKIRHVVIGMRDPNPLTNGKSIRKLGRHHIKVTTGVLQEELACINEAFIKRVTARMPFVTAKCAQTLDGKIATADGESKWITSLQARSWARKERRMFDAVMVGINTVLKDDPALTADGSKKNLYKIILDTHLRVPTNARVFRHSRPGQCVIVTAQKKGAKVNRLQKKGARILTAPVKRKMIDLAWLMRQLAKEGITHILIEGGARVIGQALQEGVVDKMNIYIAPYLMGDQAALSSIVGRPVKTLKKMIKLKDISVHHFDEDMLVTGYVYRNR